MSKDKDILLSVEEYDDVIEEMKPLFEEHWGEVALYQDKIQLSPDYNKYKLLSETGALHIVTAREEESGELVGYFVSFVIYHAHYKKVLFANNDILYLSPSHRGGDTAIAMFTYAEEALRDLGADVMTIHMKVQVPFDSLCEALEYTNVERIYSKYIKKEEE